jgi:hypothetical protein
MPRVADYTAIDTNGRTLDANGELDETFVFRLPDRLDAESPSVLYYQIEPDTAVDLTYRVKLNGSTVSELPMVGSAIRSMHQIVSANVLQTNNLIEFEIVEGSVSGRITISNILLFWQNDLAE